MLTKAEAIGNGATGEQSWSLYHVGFVVKSIAEAETDFAEVDGARWNGQVIHDPIRCAGVSF